MLFRSVDPIKQVLAKAAVAHGLLEVNVGGGDHANLGGAGGMIAHALILPVLQKSKQLGLQARGKIRHIGLSEVSVANIEHARTVVPIASVQNRYSVVDRGAEDVLDYCEKNNIAFIPWFPLAAGKVSKTGTDLVKTAAEMNVSPSQLALAWLLHRSPVMLPIPGTSKVAHLEENVASAALSIPKGTLAARSSAGA